MDPVYGWGVQAMIDGVYSICYMDIILAGSFVPVNFIAVNTTSSSTFTAPYSNVLAAGTFQANSTLSTQMTLVCPATVLKAGDIVYALASGNGNQDNLYYNSFRVTHIA